MVSVIKRARKLTDLLAIRIGPGAATFPPDVTRLHLFFAFKRAQGHDGARIFWRTCLKRLKFHNPSVPMTVTRTTHNNQTPTLTVHYASPETVQAAGPEGIKSPISSTTTSQTSTGPVAASTPAPPTERTEVLRMKNLDSHQILHRLVKMTKATKVYPSEEEKAQLREGMEFAERAAVDKKRTDAVLEKAQREKEIMDRARAMVDV